MRWMVDRLRARWWASWTIVKANSWRLQELSGVWWSSVLLLASVRTRSRSSGGKAPGSPGARGVLQAGQAVGHEALPPLADGVAVAAEFHRNVLVGRIIGLGGPQDDATAESEGVGGGAGAGQGFELAALLGCQFDRRSEGTRHG